MPTDRQAPSGWDLVREWQAEAFTRASNEKSTEDFKSFLARLNQWQDKYVDQIGSEAWTDLLVLLGTPGEAPERSKR